MTTLTEDGNEYIKKSKICIWNRWKSQSFTDVQYNPENLSVDQSIME